VGAGKTNAEFAADIERQLEEVAAGQRQMSAEVKAFYEATLEQLKNQE
jgi:DNA topoisomerase IA